MDDHVDRMGFEKRTQLHEFIALIEGLIMDQRVQIDDDNLDRNGTDC